MILVFCFCSSSSLKSFCAPRHTPKVVLGWVFTPALRSGCLTPPCVHYSLFGWVAPNFVRYTTPFDTETIVPPCGVYGQIFTKQIVQNILQKSSPLNLFHIFYSICNYARQFNNQTFTYKTRKTEWLC